MYGCVWVLCVRGSSGQARAAASSIEEVEDECRAQPHRKKVRKKQRAGEARRIDAEEIEKRAGEKRRKGQAAWRCGLLQKTGLLSGYGPEERRRTHTIKPGPSSYLLSQRFLSISCDSFNNGEGRRWSCSCDVAAFLPPSPPRRSTAVNSTSSAETQNRKKGWRRPGDFFRGKHSAVQKHLFSSCFCVCVCQADLLGRASVKVRPGSVLSTPSPTLLEGGGV